MTKCPNCGHDLVHTNHGLMCVNCGYTSNDQPRPETPATQPVASPATTPIADPILQNGHPPRPIEPPAGSTHNFNLPPATPAASATKPLTESIYPNPQNAFAPESVIDGQKATQPKSPKKLLIVLAAVLIALAIGGSAGAYALYVQAPKSAPLGYFEKLSKVKALKVGGSVTATSASGGPLNKITLTLAGNLDGNDSKNPKADLALEGSADSKKVAAELRLLDRIGYFKLEPSPLIASLLGSNDIAGQWFKIPEPEENSPTDSKCQTAYDQNLTPKFLSTFPIKDAKLVKLFDTVNGHSVRQSRGSIDTAKLPDWFDAADKKLPAECKFSVTKEQVKGVAVDYILWTSPDFDRVEFKATTDNPKYDIDLTLDTSAYNQTPKIETPAGAKNFSDFIPAAPPATSPTTFCSNKSSACKPITAPKESTKTERGNITKGASILKDLQAFVLGTR